MLIAFLTTLEQMARIFLFIVIGFVLNRLHILPKGAGTGISRLVTTLFLPALLLYSNVTEFVLSDVGAYGQLVLLGLIFFGIVVLCVYPVAQKLSGGSQLDRGAYLYGLCFPNTGAVGTPLVLAILGTAGLFQFNLFLLSFSIFTYAWGVGLFSETTQGTPIKRFFKQMRNPVFISSMVGLLLGALGAKQWLPSMTISILGDLSSCYVPVSLLMTGYTIADYPIGQVFRRPKSYVYALFRLILIPVFIMILSRVLNLSQQIAMLAVLAFSCPSGMNVVLFPASYGRDCKTGASIVLISSLGSILTIPVLYALVQVIFG